jgi:hypothetical protein
MSVIFNTYKGWGRLMVYGFWTAYLEYIFVVIFIVGGKQHIWRKPPTCPKSMTIISHKVVLSTPYDRLSLAVIGI